VSDAGVVEESAPPAIDAAPMTPPADAADARLDASTDARPRERSSSPHPARVKRRSEHPRSVAPAPDPEGNTDDPCRMDEQGNVIDRHRCKE
jgi:hypothetical protein